MLGVGDEVELSEPTWQTLTSRVELPGDIATAQFANACEVPPPNCQRRYARKFLHTLAIAILGDEYHACRTKDISRNGLGFYCPVNILPKKLLRLWLPSGNVLNLRVTRCRRLGERCFEVGTQFEGTE